MSDSCSIVFVDDDMNVLNGLRRMLRDMRGEWDMSFFNSAPAALAHMANHPVRVVVTDMRMPVMDGAELLTRVRDLYPDTIRIVLSGFAQREAAMRTVGPSHQYLSKPCDPAILANVIRRALSLRRLLKSEELRQAVTAMGPLPSPPHSFAAMLSELESEDASAASLAATIEHDTAVVAQLLKLTNSAYFGLATRVSNVETAIQMLGFETVKALFLMSGLFGQFTGPTDLASLMERVGERSLKISLIARRLAEAEGFSSYAIGDAACAALLSHIGTIVLMARRPETFRALSLQLDSGSGTLQSEEMARFGASHAAVGAYLLGLWGFNDNIVEAVAYHHQPAASEVHQTGALAVLHVAQALAVAEHDPTLLDGPLSQCVDTAFLAEAGLADRLPAWIAIVRDLLLQWHR